MKVRYSEMKYGSDNVMLCVIDKKDKFLQFITGVTMKSPII